MSKRRILVCDDDDMLVELLRYRLTARGYDVLTAHNGGEGLEIARSERPDAIVLDAMMPVMDGYQVLRQLRADAELVAIPVIMLTARRQEQDIVGALELGANDYLVKPFIPEELITRMTRLIESGR